MTKEGVGMKYKELYIATKEALIKEEKNARDYMDRLYTLNLAILLMDNGTFIRNRVKYRVRGKEGEITVVKGKGRKTEVCWQTELSEESIPNIDMLKDMEGLPDTKAKGDLLYGVLEGLGFKVE